MRIGLQIPSFTWPGGTDVIGPRLAEIGQAADEAGFYSLWVMDHYFQIRGVGKPEEPMLEGYSALNYLAGFTKRAKLGTMVTGVVYRYPGILVKTATTLDVLSSGRAYFGIGAAWFEREALGLGVPFPPIKERFERLEEALQIAKQMWSGEVAPYEGKHFHLAETLTSPQPLSKPHPPILVGGSGERKTLRLVAQYADACNLFARVGVDTLRHKLDVLRKHCEDIGRSYDEIEKTALGTVHLAPGQMSVDQVIATCRQLADLGFQHLIFNMPNVSEIKPLETFGKDIIPVVATF
ncbi:MAG: LLM class F420-dependent oxidoreductase [Anaerolineales bacterium]|jgi:F420-dependent oxidoreductase-like protein